MTNFTTVFFSFPRPTPTLFTLYPVLLPSLPCFVPELTLDEHLTEVLGWLSRKPVSPNSTVPFPTRYPSRGHALLGRVFPFPCEAVKPHTIRLVPFSQMIESEGEVGR